MVRSVAIIGAPTSAGAYAPGQEKAPDAFRKHGLVQSLQQKGILVHDTGNIAPFRWRPDPSRPKAMNLTAVQQAAQSVAERVTAAIKANEVALVLGGDCTIELGTVAGACHDGASVGLVYIDFDVDLNPPEQSDGALDWTVAAHLLNLAGTAPQLSGLGRATPLLRPSQLLLFASHEKEITPYEKNVMKEQSLRYLSLDTVKKNPAQAAEQAKQWGAQFDRLLIHVDTDVLAYTQFPIAENVRRSNGLTLQELTTILSVLTSAPQWQALTITEANPDHAPSEAETFKQLIDALCLSLAPK